MRGEQERQADMLVALEGVTPERFVPADHPIRRIKPIVEAALAERSPLFDGYALERHGSHDGVRPIVGESQGDEAKGADRPAYERGSPGVVVMERVRRQNGEQAIESTENRKESKVGIQELSPRHVPAGRDKSLMGDGDPVAEPMNDNTSA